MITNTQNKIMKIMITLTTIFIFSVIMTSFASATTCSVASSATVPVGADEVITVSCSEVGSSNTVTISPSGFSTSCMRLDSSSKQVTATSPSTTFTATGVSLACMMNIAGRTVTWTFTHSAGNSVASKTTVYNVIPTPSITPTFENATYDVINGTRKNLSITLALTTSQSQVDIRNIDITVTTSVNGTIVGLENKTDLTIDVSESTTQYVTWNLELPPLPPGQSYDFNASVTADNANPAMGTAIINVTEGSSGTTVDYTFATGNLWYLISIPVQVSNTSIASVFSDISGNYQVWGWNGGWLSFVSYYPVESNTLSTVSVSNGYWVKPTSATSFSALGSIPSSTSISLVADWNLIGYPKASTASITTLTSGMSGTYQIWGWDNGWKSFVSYYPAESNTLTTFDTGQGYWIKPSQSQDLVIS